MNESSRADTSTLLVSIVAGPSAGAWLQQIDANEAKHRVLPAGSLSAGEEEAVQQISSVAEQGQAEHLILEGDSETPPMAYASLFLAPPLTDTARLTNTVFAIRPSQLIASLTGRAANGKPTAPGFLAEQLEFVNHIVLEREREDSDFKLARDIAHTLNPRAQVSELSAEGVDDLLVGRELPPFDFTAAFDSAGWRQLIETEIGTQGEQTRITSFAYRARKPFHPQRFLALLQGGLMGVFRAKGFFWLATRMDLVGGLNLAGPELHIAAAGQWWAAREEHAREHEMPERTRKEWLEPFGDRRQAIAIMGLDFEPDVCQAQLDDCLLTDSEMAAGPANWGALPDPFPSWSVHTHTHECDHDHAHESGDRSCCHH